ncbi:hypothetical protein LCGC14_1856750 [marine sediment metagenome]|uniref:Uncharacterized protein n=1 Tax=marine sediment metagenome TaxID=412755 RepID=A0A0F9J7V2_9ZZZZ
MTDEIEEAVARAMKNASRKAYGHWPPFDESEVMAKAAMAAHKSALAKAGYKILPREATHAMERAYFTTEMPKFDARASHGKRNRNNRAKMLARWQAMWDAHPDKPAG